MLACTSKDPSELSAELSSPDHRTRRRAAEELGELGSDAQVAVPALVELLNDPHWTVRFSCMWALKRIGTERAISALRSTVPHLIRLLRHPDRDVRWSAATAIGHVGKDAKAAVPELIRRLADESHQVKNAAAYSLRRIGDPVGLRAIKISPK